MRPFIITRQNSKWFLLRQIKAQKGAKVFKNTLTILQFMFIGYCFFWVPLVPIDISWPGQAHLTFYEEVKILINPWMKLPVKCCHKYRKKLKYTPLYNTLNKIHCTNVSEWSFKVTRKQDVFVHLIGWNFGNFLKLENSS